VEVQWTAARALIRDSKNPTAGMLDVGGSAWSTFLRQVATPTPGRWD
jgi:hypothetical protein